MKKQAMAVAFAFGVGFAMPAVGQEFELVGHTPGGRTGAAGVLVWNEDCDNSFPGSRVCTSGDLLRGNLPVRFTDPTPNATNWVLPTVVGNSGTSLIDASGIVGSPANLTCNAYTSGAATVTGLSINDRGYFVLAGCNGQRSLACCAAP